MNENNIKNEQENKIDLIFQQTDIHLEHCIQSFNKFENIYENLGEIKKEEIETFENEKTLLLERFEKIKKAVFDITEIIEKWIKDQKIFDFFYKTFSEHIHFIIFISKKIKNVILKSYKHNECLKPENNLFFEINNIIVNINSLLDKIAYAYLRCNFSFSIKDERIKFIKQKFNKTYFHSVHTILDELLNREKSSEKFLEYVDTITSTKYWKKIHKISRNFVSHKYFGYGECLRKNHLIFIFIDFYVSLKSIWCLSINNWDEKKAITNLENSYNNGNSDEKVLNWKEFFYVLEQGDARNIKKIFSALTFKTAGGSFYEFDD